MKKIKMEFPILKVSIKNPDPKLVAAAKKTAKMVKKHFKKDGWDLDFSFLVYEVFQQAYGVDLENYLLQELAGTKIKIALKSSIKTVLKK